MSWSISASVAQNWPNSTPRTLATYPGTPETIVTTTVRILGPRAGRGEDTLLWVSVLFPFDIKLDQKLTI